jgi:hypothetical protein
MTVPLNPYEDQLRREIESVFGFTQESYPTEVGLIQWGYLQCLNDLLPVVKGARETIESLLKSKYQALIRGSGGEVHHL